MNLNQSKTPDLVRVLTKQRSDIEELKRRVIATSESGTEPTGPAGGDLAGSYPNPVIGSGKVTNTHLAGSIANSKLSTNPLSRDNHTGSQLASTISDFSSSVLALIPSSLPPNGSAGGDLTGSYPNPSIGSGKVTNAMLAGSIAYNKLSLTGSITNSDLAGSIAYSKLNLSGSVTNSDLAGSIAYNKLNLSNSVTNGDLAGSIANSKLATNPLNRANHTGSPSSDVNMGAYKLTGLASGTASSHGVNLEQLLDEVDTARAGFTFRPQVDLISTSGLPPYAGSGTSAIVGSSNGAINSAFGLEGETLNWVQQLSLSPSTSGVQAVAVSPAGNIWVSITTDTSQGRLYKLDSSGNTIGVFGSAGTGNGQFGNTPYSIVCDTSNNVYVASDSRIQKFNSSGVYQASVGGIGSGNGQFGDSEINLSIDSSNNIYATDNLNTRIQKFNSSLSYQTQYSASNTLHSTKDIWVDPSGNMYIVENTRVRKLNSSGTQTAVFNGIYAYSITGDSSGNFYVGSIYNKIQKYNSSGVLLFEYGSNGIGHGQFVFISSIFYQNSTDNLYVADRNRAEKFVKISSPIAIGKSVLIKDQGNGTHVDNGIWDIVNTGSPSTKWSLRRRDDANENIEVVSGLMINGVRKGGQVPGGTYYITTPDPINIYSTPVAWEQYLPGGWPLPHANSHLPGGSDPLPATGPFRAYRNAALNIGSGSNVSVVFDAEDFDIEGWYDTSTGRYTPQVPGIYHVAAFAGIAALTNSPANQYFQINLLINGVPNYDLGLVEYQGTPNYPRLGGSTIVRLNGSTDYVSIALFQNSGSNKAMNTGSGEAYFTAYRVG